jgi:hypothetical protein
MSHPDTIGLNARGHMTLLSVARFLAWRVNWDTGLAWPTRAAAAEAAGCSERTITRWWKWLEIRGFVRVTEPGTLPRFRPGVLAGKVTDGQGALAREFLLTFPVRSFVTPTQEDSDPPRTRETDPASNGGKITDKRPSDDPVVTIRRASVTMRRIRPGPLAGLVKPFLGHAYSAGDLLFALDHDRDGRPHRHTDPPRHPYGWARARLARWTGPDGTPFPPWSQVLADRARAHHERTAADRARYLPAGPAGDPVRGAAAVRAQMMTCPAAARAVHLAQARGRRGTAAAPPPPPPTAPGAHPGSATTTPGPTSWPR